MHGNDENPGFDREWSFVSDDRDGANDNTGTAEPGAVLRASCDLMEGGRAISGPA